MTKSCKSSYNFVSVYIFSFYIFIRSICLIYIRSSVLFFIGIILWYCFTFIFI
nr:MAG TPA: hypothetical protein [Crassvirales sp.]